MSVFLNLLLFVGVFYLITKAACGAERPSGPGVREGDRQVDDKRNIA